MRFFSMFLVVGSSMFFNFSPCQQAAQRGERSDTPEASAQTREILVKFRSAVPEDSISTLAATEGLQLVQDLRGIGVRVYRVPAGSTAQDVIKKLQADPRVEYAEPNLEYKIPEKEN